LGFGCSSEFSGRKTFNFFILLDSEFLFIFEIHLE